MDSPHVPRWVFVAYYPEGPHAGPVTIGLFGAQDGALLPVFASREKAIDFAVRVLGSPPDRGERWDGVELPAADLARLLLGDDDIRHVAVNPSPSGDAELTPTPEFAESLRSEPEDAGLQGGDFRRSLVRTLVYGDVS